MFCFLQFFIPLLLLKTQTTDLFLAHLLGSAHPGDLGVRVDDGGHAHVVDVRRPPAHALHADDALVLGLVRQHRACDHVADRVDAAKSMKWDYVRC